MPQLTQAKFRGIAPSRSAFQGQAALAENADLSGGGLKPVKAPSFVEPGHSGAITFHNEAWVSGEDFYIPTNIQGIPALIYKTTEGQWKINMANLSSADLWLDAPQELAVESSMYPAPPSSVAIEQGSGAVTPGDYEYFTRLVQVDADGNEVRESAFSTPLAFTVTNGRVRFTRPALSNLPAQSKWQIFRRASGGTYAYKIGEAPITTGYIYDELENVFFGEAIYPEAFTPTAIDYRYVAVWVRNFGGWEHESVPSEIETIHQATKGVKITLAETPPEGVTSWRIYRISLGEDPTTTFQLVADITAGTTEYLDYAENVELGAAMQSSYRADNGALVTAGVPADQFTGMAGPFNGFFVGWIGRDLYLSQPGNPTWWPGAFVVEANFDIVGVSQVGGNIAVITEGGVQFGYGVDPTAFALSQSVFGPGGADPKAIDKDVYLGHTGIYAVTDQGVQLLTQDFDREYFDNLTIVKLVFDNDSIILFHTTGGLMYDRNDGEWTTLSANDFAFTAVHAVGGYIYGLRNGAIVKIFGSYDDTTMDYEGTTDFGEAAVKRIESLRLYGSGDARVELRAIEDEAEILSNGTVQMDSGYEPERTIYAPAWLNTEAIRYRITGKGRIRSIMFEVEKGSTES